MVCSGIGLRGAPRNSVFTSGLNCSAMEGGDIGIGSLNNGRLTNGDKRGFVFLRLRLMQNIAMSASTIIPVIEPPE